MNGQEQMPLYEALQHHIQSNPLSFHVPGHKGGLLFKEKSKLFAADITEITGMDDLYHPTGILLKAQKLLTDLYGSDNSLFLVNGSTVGNLAMIYGTCSEGDLVLVQRNCHKSIIHGLMLAKVRPVFLEPEYERDWGIAKGISIQTLADALKLYPEAKALIVTYPNYYGMADKIEDLIKLAHKYKIPVLVDEAHGAHFIGKDPFLRSSLQLGADVVVQSAHKTLPSLTMGAYLHIREGLIRAESIQQALSILQTSSPSYLIMASLDYARSYIGTFTENDLQFWRKYKEEIHERLSAISGINIYQDPFTDPLKVTLKLTNGDSGQTFQRLLEEQGIYPEFSDPANVLLIFPLFKKAHEKEALAYLNVLEDALKKITIYTAKEREKKHSPFQSSSNRVRTPEVPLYQAKVSDKRWIPITEAPGKVSGGMIIPYPPGIPLIMPGESIEQRHIEELKRLLEHKTHIQGDGWNENHQILVLA
ncbi:MAG TPA: aminotransferase class I/II-fold pyridoxal phosphate-dependent enzyme [Bacillus sp. (in: firmicutes)]|uniref:aminotransferase class I/II-fold pyridoxal phosphate-dependent enzyme n=1 Tax=Bacillus litorisediminis TaxID=2922713 RepID=UPI001FAD1F17|nr:aminotransferase class I/II-fold pyridoxal phosphate-dependent enzyme [Bacillus litorisediminis]HWO76075.1 aminotransferase class I/II-fold pyridoxal phosphate-dependent enzyme [Bacillus sp. (in: firmicutes)]